MIMAEAVESEMDLPPAGSEERLPGCRRRRRDCLQERDPSNSNHAITIMKP